MIKPEEFILASDYATLKNDDRDILTIVLPSSVNIPAMSYATYSSQMALGVKGSSIRSVISSTKDNHSYVLSSITYVNTTGAVVSGSGVGYELHVTVNRVSETEVRLFASIANPHGATMAVSGLAQTLTARVATFLPPFS